MGAGDKQTGIILPVLTIPEGQATDIELTFVAASNIGGDGTGTARRGNRHSRHPQKDPAASAISKKRANR